MIALGSIAEGGSSTSFTALLLEHTPLQSDTGVILLHGRGGEPDSAVVSELRRDLHNRGYTMLFIQEPVPAGNSEVAAEAPPFSEYVADIGALNFVFPETCARIRAAINYLEKSNTGITKIVLIGFSMGSRMASAPMESGRLNELPVIGLVGVGMCGTSIAPLSVSLTFDGCDAPLLYIYGSSDTSAVKVPLPERQPMWVQASVR